MAEKKDIPWDMVGVDYREGILSPNGIVEKRNKQFSRRCSCARPRSSMGARHDRAKVAARAHEIVDAAEAAGVTAEGDRRCVLQHGYRSKSSSRRSPGPNHHRTQASRHACGDVRDARPDDFQPAREQVCRIPSFTR